MNQLIQDSVPPAFQWPIKFCTAVTGFVYVASELTGNVSQVDRVWTFLPTIYTAYWALLPLWPSQPTFPLQPYTPKELSTNIAADYSPRALLMLGLINLWMFRLSYNTYRRGLFSIWDEDYRWEVLRQRIPKWLFKITNLTFIAIIQNVILFLLGIPAHAAITQPHTPLGQTDYALAGFALLTLLVEFTADNQQFAYQTFKRSDSALSTETKAARANSHEWPGARLRWTKQDAERGFITRGLWAWSRHPNFCCEQTFWILITLFPILARTSPSLRAPDLPFAFSAVATTEYWGPGLVVLVPLTPCLVLCSLFFASTLFSESISLGKYPVAYGAYKKRVAMFFPVNTLFKGVWLAIKGEKARADKLVYGDSKAR